MKKQNAVRGRSNQRERSEGHGRELWNLPPAHRVGRGSETFVPQNPEVQELQAPGAVNARLRAQAVNQKDGCSETG